MGTTVFTSERLQPSRLARGANESAAPRRAFERRTLNIIDEAMFSVGQSLQQLGSGGFETQIALWLSQGLDAEKLRRAIAQLSRSYRVLSSRLVPRRFGSVPYFRFREGAECPLQETRLETADAEGTLEFCAKLLSSTRDLQNDDPIWFHLAHLPDGRAVFLMQFPHALMDYTAAGLALQEIDALFAGNRLKSSESDEQIDLIDSYRSRFSSKRRLKAAWQTWNLRMRGLRGEVAVLHDRTTYETNNVFRIARRALSEGRTAAVFSRVAETCGYPGVSMAVLGSAFRAIQSVSGEATTSARRYVAGIGLDLGLRKSNKPIFQNGVSVVPVHVLGSDLDDRQSLTRLLNAQLRERLAMDIDLGVVELASLFRPFPRFIRRKTKRLMRDGYSLWYAYFGRMTGIGNEFCGVQVEDAAAIGPAWSGPGLTLMVNHWQGRLVFQATYAPSIVAVYQVHGFLDFLISDLVGG